MKDEDLRKKRICELSARVVEFRVMVRSLQADLARAESDLDRYVGIAAMSERVSREMIAIDAMAPKDQPSDDGGIQEAYEAEIARLQAVINLRADTYHPIVIMALDRLVAIARREVDPQVPGEERMDADADHRWYERMLSEYAEDGAKDAVKGVFDAPYGYEPDNPESEDANEAYKSGFDKKRGELGEDFKWQ